MRLITVLAVLGLALAPRAGRANGQPGFTLQVNHVNLYMTHYALFEEPDPSVPPGVYIDAATGMPTNELSLAPPCETLQFAAAHDPHSFVGVSLAPTQSLPYFVDPPGFPPLPAPPEVVGAISAVLGGAVPSDVIAANTTPLLVAIGHFEPTPGDITAQKIGNKLTVARDVEFEVKVRVGFRFQPPPGLPVPPVGILIGWLTRGLVDQLIGQAPDPATANDLVVYNWRSTLNMSTENSYVRTVATEPSPVADGFPDGLSTISFVGKRIDDQGGYSIVGSAAHVPFDAPPELALFLFGTPVLTDVEFAVEESGVLISNGSD